MGGKEQSHAADPTIAKRLFRRPGVDLRIRVHVADALDVDHYCLALSDGIGKVRKGLRRVADNSACCADMAHHAAVV